MSKGIESPIESKMAFSNAIRFFGKDKSPNYTGPGILIYPSKVKFSKAFIGHFQMGKRHGKGFRLAMNKLYIGEYFEDQKNGNAQIWDISSQYEKIKTFEGQYQNGFMHGDCYYKNADHEFQGNINKGLYNGFSTILYNNGTKFEGMMVNGVINGRAKIYYNNGDIYEGVLRNNEMTGEGKYVWN